MGPADLAQHCLLLPLLQDSQIAGGGLAIAQLPRTSGSVPASSPAASLQKWQSETTPVLVHWIERQFKCCCNCICIYSDVLLCIMLHLHMNMASTSPKTKLLLCILIVLVHWTKHGIGEVHSCLLCPDEMSPWKQIYTSSFGASSVQFAGGPWVSTGTISMNTPYDGQSKIHFPRTTV